ncbi:MAG TPA: phosphate ABC transporter substrate-binding protein [Cyanobacteria bacterium UBA8803]|nr:phosphate ABC transporter substrate-binding protein [Cyanobacteria bacterium UBA9273]HBL57607.1 phosphate ABC transporter substrate-binding protein [Cyanobacteria bacterium UBA8803]
MSSRNPLNELTLIVLALFGTLGILVCALVLYKWIFADGDNQLGQSTCKNLPTGLFNYGGSTTWAPIRRDVDPVIQKICSQFQLRYTDHPTRTPGSGTGIEMVIDNQLDFSQSSRSLKAEEQQLAQQKGFSLKEIPVAIDGIAIAIHPELDVRGITVEQLRQIYTGQITNWNQVGGPDINITPYSRRKEDGGTVEFFVENVLQKQDFGNNVKFVYSTTDGLQKVAQTIGGLYYASAPEVVGQCTINPLPLINKSNHLIAPYQEPFIPPARCPNQRNHLNATAFQNGDYPITRKLFVIVQHNNGIEQKAGEAYANWLLTPEAQQLIEKAGFVKIR